MSAVGNFRLSLSHYTLLLQKVDGSNLQVAGFSASCQHFIGGYLWEVRSHIEVRLYGRVMQLSFLFNGRSCGFRIKIHPHNNLLLSLCQ